MGEELTYKNIGRRLAEFRKQKGLSQEDLAKRVKISRPSLAQIELGNRSISVLELNKFSIILGISFDHLLSTDSSPVELQESKAVYKIKSKE
jgi:transcriptional regulator with XRE-family HTH domain